MTPRGERHADATLLDMCLRQALASLIVGLAWAGQTWRNAVRSIRAAVGRRPRAWALAVLGSAPHAHASNRGSEFAPVAPALRGALWWGVIAVTLIIGMGTTSASAQAVVTIQQVSSGRYMDAHETGNEDYRVVTRTAQNNDTQRWIMTFAGASYTFQQVSTGRYLDAYLTEDGDFQLVTRPAQNDTTQQWVLTDLGSGTYTIEQLRNRRFVDAYESANEDYGVVTRSAQNNSTQRWRIQIISVAAQTDRIVTLQQASSGRFVDAHVTASEDFSVVTRSAQNNNTQYWVMTRVGETTNFTFRQVSTGRFLDGYLTEADDFRLVTRGARSGAGQQWTVTTLGGGALFTIQHSINGRFVDAHESADQDFRLVTRPRQNNDTQAWRIQIISGAAF